MNINYWVLSCALYLLIFVFLLELASAHLDQQCTFRRCLSSSLLPIKHAFCDNDNRCRCEKGYVPVSHHRCAEIQNPGKPCEHDNVCRFKDENSYCDQNRRHSVCECKKSHIYDFEQKKCIPYVKKSKKSTPLFPMTAIILIACIGIFCGCAIICHNFRRQPEFSNSVEQIDRISTRHSNNNTSSGDTYHSTRNGGSNNPQNDTSDSDVSHPPLLRSDTHLSSSKYDSLLYDDPPPKYEDAIKEYPEGIIIESQIVNQTSRPVVSIKS